MSTFVPISFFLRSYPWEPNLLIQLFTFLAFSGEHDLGFDTGIQRVNNSDFELCFPVQETNYLHWGQGGLETGNYMLGTFRAHVHLTHNVTGG